MSKKQRNKNNVSNAQGSGSRYHEQHAGNVADYGGNTKDPVAEKYPNQKN